MSEMWEFGDAPEASADGEPAAATGEADQRPGPDEPRSSIATPAFPWPPPEDRPILPAFAETWRRATFEPTGLFRTVPAEGGTGAAFVFFLVLAILVAGVGLFWESVATVIGGGSGGALASQLGTEALDPLVGFLLTPGLLALGLLLSAGVTHILLLVLRGATCGFGTSFRVFCYAYSPAVFVVVPLLGALVGSVWVVVLLVIGLREAHRIDGWKAAVAVLLPVALMTMLLVLAFLVVIAAGAALLAGSPA